jgi:hypothetical protein
MEGTCTVRVPFSFFGVRLWRRQGFTFTMETWMSVSSYTQLALTELDKLERERFFSVMYYQAARTYDFFNRKYHRFTEKDVMVWLAKMPVEDMQKIFTTMITSRIGGESINVLIDKYLDSEKKKSR